MKGTLFIEPPPSYVKSKERAFKSLDSDVNDLLAKIHAQSLKKEDKSEYVKRTVIKLLNQI